MDYVDRLVYGTDIATWGLVRKEWPTHWHGVGCAYVPEKVATFELQRRLPNGESRTWPDFGALGCHLRTWQRSTMVTSNACLGPLPLS